MIALSNQPSVISKEGLSSKKLLCLTVGALLFALCLSAEAQQPAKIYRIGYLSEGFSLGSAPLLEAFRKGLRELGYNESKNLLIEARWSEGQNSRLPDLAAELVRLNVDVILAAPTPPALAAQQATKAIPIVVAHMSAPVEAGLVASLARPGGNVTGLRSLQAELAAKRLELLKEAFPNVSRVAVLGAGIGLLGGGAQMRAMEGAARRLGLELRTLDWRRHATPTPGVSPYLSKRADPNFQNVFRSITEMRASAFTVISSPLHLDYLPQILDLAAKSRLPAIYPNRTYVDAGGLMSYGTYLPDLYRRAAIYVDKILKGAKPADLPVEQPTKFELVINLKAAKSLDLTIPPQLLMDADKVIK